MSGFFFLPSGAVSFRFFLAPLATQVEDGRALPAGTNKTDDAGLARLLGGVQVVSIPIMMSGEFDAVRSVDQIQLLLVRLRQVNGDGVMSRVSQRYNVYSLFRLFCSAPY